MPKPIIFPHPYYPQIFAAKTVVQYQEKFLIIREPLTASWKPGKWSLPGGKIDPGEDWLTALHREIHEELGQPIEPQGIIAIEEIVYINPRVQQQQLTHHIVTLSTLVVPQPFTAKLNCEHQWLTLTELQKIPVSELSEFYLPALWQRVADPSFQLLPLDMIQIWDGTKNTKFTEWYQLK